MTRRCASAVEGHVGSTRDRPLQIRCTVSLFEAGPEETIPFLATFDAAFCIISYHVIHDIVAFQTYGSITAGILYAYLPQFCC